MIKDKKTAIVGGLVGIVMLLTVFCCNGKNESQESSTQPMVDDVTSQVELSPFEDTFRSNRDLYGAGYIFEWNGQEYTTDWKEELNN